MTGLPVSSAGLRARPGQERGGLSAQGQRSVNAWEMESLSGPASMFPVTQ